jgi:hypothetical protein
MRAMAVDAVTAEAMSALADAGVESVLLKGPSIAGWLYDDPAERPYVDSDLLVDPALAARAHATLERIGFRRGFGPLPHPGMEDAPSYPWERGDAVVDLHETLPGAGAERARVWRVLRAGCDEQRIGGRTALVLGEPARLVHVALHASHHGPSVERPVEDLRRAVTRAADEAWAAAATVAREIEALGAFAAGLALLPEGRERLRALGLEPPPRAPRAVRAPDARDVPLAAGFTRLAAAPGLRAKASLLREELLPSPSFMRWWTPLARRSRRGLAAAYALRWLYLARNAPRGAAAARRSRKKRREFPRLGVVSCGRGDGPVDEGSCN